MPTQTRRLSTPSGRRLYVGRLPPDCEKRQIEDLFSPVGDIIDIRVLGGFAFVEFERIRDAERAVRDLHGQQFEGAEGVKLTIYSRSQDLKDLGREVGVVTFADLDRNDPCEYIEFGTRDSAEKAIRDLDRMTFRGSKIYVTDADESSSRSHRRDSGYSSRSTYGDDRHSRNEHDRDDYTRDPRKDRSKYDDYGGGRERDRSRSPAPRARERSRSPVRSGGGGGGGTEAEDGW
ncbi:hypothetical protein BCR35DRAFT_322492 [Leucosporidium creatinivorum]|uniref:RRM domain-containing protein n=1 Tax=Leucosporidium creatinivorum TaxID=106004 RepID=A0A1Y2DPG6_9BASI|nr:hypothetical protein BCR35DRAFT_322492 [Leucosporidium creatinivorum]